MKKTTSLYKTANRVALTLTVIAVLGGIAATAWARDDWHGHAREARAWHDHHWRNGRVVYGGGEPYVAYAPPLVVEPPPEYTDPGINIVLPLNIR